jgi:hypothetical protein
MKIARRYRDRILAEDSRERQERNQRARENWLDQKRREAASAPKVEHPTQTESVVYYVQLGDHIKIGYSARLRERLHALRAEPDALLAVEPGGRRLEDKRHQQFAHLRIKSRWENFEPGDELLAHIADLKAEHGLPDYIGPRPRRDRRATPVVVRRIDQSA